MSSGVFPSCLKIARVVPVFKKGDPEKVQNYRPISNILILGKIFEKIICGKLYKYLIKYKILSDKQFGFRSNLSTDDTVLEYLDAAYESLNSGNYFVSVFLDFSRAFDTVNHKILLDKLNAYGVRGSILSWFKSYLTDRKLFVSIGDSTSGTNTVNIGLPQGSVAGPLLFLLYINDMSSACSHMKCVHYADDTTAFLSGVDATDLVDCMNYELGCLDQWLMANRLSLNVGKTKFMMTTNRNISSELDLRIRGVRLKQVDSYEILGVIVDHKLNFVEHMDVLCKKLARSAGAMYRISMCAPRDVMRGIYFSLLYSKMCYGILAWGGGHLSSWRRIERVQRRAVIILGRGGSCCPFHAHGLLKLGLVYRYFSLIKFYKIQTFQHHPHFFHKTQSMQTNHGYVTRFKNEGKLCPPLFRKASGHKSFIFNSVNHWNKLPESIRKCTSLPDFKIKLKSFLLKHPCYEN